MEYDLLGMIEDDTICRNLMRMLENQQTTLTNLMATITEQIIGFNIEQITKLDEANVIKTGIQSLQVTEATHASLLNYHKQYYRDITLSTRFVDRKPGLVVIDSQKDKIRVLVNTINYLKDEIINVVNNDRDQLERHDFIHRLFPRIMTVQLRRHIHIIEDNVTNAWFNWTRRPIPETLSVEESILFLEQEKDKPRSLISANEWKAMIEASIDNIRTNNYKSVQRLKRLKLLPIMSYQYKEDGEYKRKTKNANTPILLLGQQNNELPKISSLKNHFKPEDYKVTRKLRNSKQKNLINGHFKLVGIKR